MVSNAHVYQLTVSINFVTKRKKKDKEAFEIIKKKNVSWSRGVACSEHAW